jgi:O-antigen ligase
VLAAIVLLPIVQLIPLPPAIWTALPGRAPIAADLRQGEMLLPWLGISLNPQATLFCLLALIPPAAVFLSALQLGRHARRMLIVTLIAFAFVSVVLGIAQLAQGPESGLRFYAVTNPGEAVGFFANRNHYAALLYGMLPFTAAVVLGLAGDRRPAAAIALILCLLVLVSLLLGLGMARSRAGLLLAVAIGFGCMTLPVAARNKVASTSPWPGRRLIYIALPIAIILIVQFASVRVMQRLDADIGEDLRWQLNATTFGALSSYLPFGSGFGTFESIYRMLESTGQLFQTYVNHAHDDYVEIALEGGVPAAGVFGAFMIWFAAASWQAWLNASRSSSVLDQHIRRAASIVILALLLHSAVDYPLRTTAIATLLSLSCALIVQQTDSHSSSGRTVRRDFRPPRKHRHRAEGLPLAEEEAISVSSLQG